jgi:Asp-tRNA(Asn)/Glu-tRNA(Gln) amidotransferase A subunit family amidase
MARSLPSADEYAEGLVRRRQLGEQFAAVLSRYDVIVSPTMHVVAPQIDDGWDDAYDDPWMGTPFTAVVNMLRLTAMSAPVGLVDGLPVGLQVIGRAGDEATVLHVCQSLENIQPWTSRPDLAAGGVSKSPRYVGE